MHDEIAATCGPADAAAFDDFVVWLRELYELEMPHFIDRNFNSPLDLVSSPRVAARLVRMGGFRRLGPVVAERSQTRGYIGCSASRRCMRGCRRAVRSPSTR
jgi:phytoene desaturase